MPEDRWREELVKPQEPRRSDSGFPCRYDCPKTSKHTNTLNRGKSSEHQRLNTSRSKLANPYGGNVADLQEAAEGSRHRCILVDTREQVPVQSPRCMPPVAKQE